MSEPMPEMTDLIAQLSVEFEQMSQERHNFGLGKYGEFSWLGKDMFEEAIFECVDAANYMRYQFIKLRLLQMAIASDPRVTKFADDGGEITIGVNSFKGAQT
jgi:hypothetical protein